MPDTSAPPDLSPDTPDTPGAPGTLRARAERAERQAAQLEQQLTTLESQLNDARNSILEGERARGVDAALVSAGAIDLEVARPLIDAARSADNADADPETLVAQLRSRKPWLFRVHTGPRVSALSPAPPDEPDAALTSAARTAATHGDRASLLRYLRLRRATH